MVTKSKRPLEELVRTKAPILRKSTRIPNPPDRFINTSGSLANITTKRRRLNPGSTSFNSFSSSSGFPFSEIAAPQAFSSPVCPLLTLPFELLQQIALYLSPRESLFFSLTSRYLYYGALSAENSFLWYQLGRFSELVAGLPGYHPRWLENARWYLNYEIPENVRRKFLRPGLEQEKFLPEHAIAFKLRIGKLMDAGRDRKRRLMPERPRWIRSCAAKRRRNFFISDNQIGEGGEMLYVDPLTILEKYHPLYGPGLGLPPTGVGYKRMLTMTMLGDVEMGCQWCLASPFVKQVVKGWEMRLCQGCFSANVLPVSEIRKYNINIDMSKLKLGTSKIIRCGHMCTHIGSHCTGAFKPTVEKLIRESYGPEASYKTILQQKKEAEKLAAEAYLCRQRRLVFEYIKVLWENLAEDSVQLTTTGTWKSSITENSPGGEMDKGGEKDDKAENNVNHVNISSKGKGLKKPFLVRMPCDEDVNLWLRECFKILACSLPAKDLKFEWFFPNAPLDLTDSQGADTHTIPILGLSKSEIHNDHSRSRYGAMLTFSDSNNIDPENPETFDPTLLHAIHETHRRSNHLQKASRSAAPVRYLSRIDNSIWTTAHTKRFPKMNSQWTKRDQGPQWLCLSAWMVLFCTLHRVKRLVAVGRFRVGLMDSSEWETLLNSISQSSLSRPANSNKNTINENVDERNIARERVRNASVEMYNALFEAFKKRVTRKYEDSIQIGEQETTTARATSYQSIRASTNTANSKGESPTESLTQDINNIATSMAGSVQLELLGLKLSPAVQPLATIDLDMDHSDSRPVQSESLHSNTLGKPTVSSHLTDITNTNIQKWELLFLWWWVGIDPNFSPTTAPNSIGSSSNNLSDPTNGTSTYAVSHLTIPWPSREIMEGIINQWKATGVSKLCPGSRDNSNVTDYDSKFVNMVGNILRGIGDHGIRNLKRRIGTKIKPTPKVIPKNMQGTISKQVTNEKALKQSMKGKGKA